MFGFRRKVAPAQDDSNDSPEVHARNVADRVSYLIRARRELESRRDEIFDRIKGCPVEVSVKGRYRAVIASREDFRLLLEGINTEIIRLFTPNEPVYLTRNPITKISP